MKLRYVAIFLASILLTSIILSYGFLSGNDPNVAFGSFFVGVDVAYESMDENKELIDKVSSCTNLFVIGCTGITHNTSKLNEICQYAYDNGLSFIVYTDRPLQYQWVEEAIARWGDCFLGFYLWDENGGKQIDLSTILPVMQADNYTDAAHQFVNRMKSSVVFMNYSSFNDRPLFTSDYVLYWFVYKSGYDVLLAQFGWNYSRQLNVALCRGAATMQDKEWGVIISWTYDHPPYIGSGPELYEDLVLAYENGAKYVVIFDSDKNYTQGILKEEHFKALRDFKQYTVENPIGEYYSTDRIAFVLPKDYGYGFRGPDDKIWGLWESDALSVEISQKLGGLLEQYGKKLDVIYDDGLALDDTYSRYIFWNNTIHSP